MEEGEEIFAGTEREKMRRKLGVIGGEKLMGEWKRIFFDLKIFFVSIQM